MNTKTVFAENVLPVCRDHVYADQGVQLKVAINPDGFKLFIDFSSSTQPLIEMTCHLLKYQLESTLRRMYLAEPPSNVDVNTSLFVAGERFAVTAIRNSKTALKYFDLVKGHLLEMFNRVAFTQELIEWEEADADLKYWFVNKHCQAKYSSHKPVFNPTKREFELPVGAKVIDAQAFGFMGDYSNSVVERGASSLFYMPENMKKLLNLQAA